MAGAGPAAGTGQFWLMPLMHLEKRAVRETALLLIERLHDPRSVDAARRHRDGIRRLGRLRQRNASLGWATSAMGWPFCRRQARAHQPSCRHSGVITVPQARSGDRWMDASSTAALGHRHQSQGELSLKPSPSDKQRSPHGPNRVMQTESYQSARIAAPAREHEPASD